MKILNLITAEKECEELRRYLQHIGQPYYFFLRHCASPLVLDKTFTVTNYNRASYGFDRNIGNPTLELKMGKYYRFELGLVRMRSHPFSITDKNGNLAGNVDKEGVTLFTDIALAPYKYQCTIHSAMNGTLLVDKIKGDVIHTFSPLPVLTVCQNAGLLKDYDYTLETGIDTCINFEILYARLNGRPIRHNEILTGPCILTPVQLAEKAIAPLQPGKAYRHGRIFYNPLDPASKTALLDLYICLYNRKIIQYYIDFVGRYETLSLVTRFKVENFTGTWYQVATSASTFFLGTGPGKRAVQAVYTVNPSIPGAINVENSAINEIGQKIEISGISLPRSLVLPVCRTVQFQSAPGGSGPLPIGDYWIIYLSPNNRTLVVGAPLIINGVLKDPSFGIYVLARDRAEYAADVVEQLRLRFIYVKYGYTKVSNTPIPTA